jgi:hypothetical protein
MLAFNVTFFEDMRLCHPKCHPYAIGFLDNGRSCSGLCDPVPDMYEMEKNYFCRRRGKSPLPYMPSAHGHFDVSTITRAVNIIVGALQSSEQTVVPFRKNILIDDHVK